eukprot:m51a1_g10362 hypothetical protein (1828) ;mRNA; r:59099-68626
MSSPESLLCMAALAGNADYVLSLLVETPSLARSAPPRALVDAARSNHVAVVDALLRSGVDPNVAVRVATPFAEEASVNALYVACEAGNSAVVARLLSAGAKGPGAARPRSAEPRASTELVASPMWAACHEGRFEVVRQLVDAHVSLEDGLSGERVETGPLGDRSVAVTRQSPLFAAVRGGRLEIVDLLLAAGAIVNAEGHDGSCLVPEGSDRPTLAFTPLHAACAAGSVAMVRKLVAAGADVNRTDRDGNAALHEACRRGDAAMVSALLDAGARTDERLNERKPTALYLAVQSGDRDCVELLVRAGADPNEHVPGDTPLKAAVAAGRLDLVQCLLAAKGLRLDDVPRDTSYSTGAAYPPLVQACEAGSLEMVRALVGAGADLNARGASDLTPLLMAVEKGRLDVIEELVAHGAKINGKAGERVPLALAVKRGAKDIAALLVNAGAELNGRPDSCPLALACEQGAFDVVKLLTDAGADANGRGKDSPLFLACQKKRVDIVTELLQNGASANPKGRSPLCCALMSGKKTLVDLLLEYGAEMPDSHSQDYQACQAQLGATHFLSLEAAIKRKQEEVSRRTPTRGTVPRFLEKRPGGFLGARPARAGKQVETVFVTAAKMTRQATKVKRKEEAAHRDSRPQSSSVKSVVYAAAKVVVAKQESTKEIEKKAAKSRRDKDAAAASKTAIATSLPLPVQQLQHNQQQPQHADPGSRASDSSDSSDRSNSQVLQGVTRALLVQQKTVEELKTQLELSRKVADERHESLEQRCFVLETQVHKLSKQLTQALSRIAALESKMTLSDAVSSALGNRIAFIDELNEPYVFHCGGTVTVSRGTQSVPVWVQSNNKDRCKLWVTRGPVSDSTQMQQCKGVVCDAHIGRETLWKGTVVLREDDQMLGINVEYLASFRVGLKIDDETSLYADKCACALQAMKCELNRIEEQLPPLAPVLYVATVCGGRVVSERLSDAGDAEELQEARTAALDLALSLGTAEQRATRRTASGALVAARVYGPMVAACALGSSAREDEEAAPVLLELVSVHDALAHPLFPKPFEPPARAGVTCARTGAVLRVERVRVRALMTEIGARVAMEVSVANGGAEAAEALFALPLPSGAAVVSFGARADDGRVLAGELRERGAAQVVYDDAIAGGSGAALLEQSGSGGDAVFTAALGSLQAGHRVELSVAWVADVRVLLGRRVSFTLPASALPATTAEVPRAAPAVAEDALELAGVEGTVDIECDMRGSGSDIEEVVCPPKSAWDVTVARAGPQRATVSLASRWLPEGDLCVSVLLAQSTGGASRAVVESNAATGSSCVMAALRVPDEPQAVEQRAREVVFVVDRSGSMENNKKIQQVQDALRLLLSSLPVGSLFNIVGFGSSFQKLFPESREYTTESVAIARSYVDALKADMQGTMLLEPLQCVLDAPVSDNTTRCVFVLTDGDVEHPYEVIECVRSRRDPSHCTVFGLGIGKDCYRSLLQSLADASHGVAEFAEAQGSIEPLIMRLLGAAMLRSVSHLSVEWPAGLSLQLSCPEPLPSAVLCGETLRVYAVVDASEDLRGKSVVLTGTSVGPSNAPVRVELPLDGSVQTEGSLLHTICARQFMRDHGHEEHKEAVTAVATRFGLASPYTSFVVVERRDGAQEGSLVQARLASSDARAAVDPRVLECLIVISSASELFHSWFSPTASAVPQTQSTAEPEDDGDDWESDEAEAAPDKRVGRGLLRELAIIQDVAGFWSPASLCSALAVDEVALLAAAPARLRHQCRTEEEVLGVWATAVALAVLEEAVPELQSEWLLLHSKAFKWLCAQVDARSSEPEAVVSDLVTSARRAWAILTATIE